MDGKIHYIVTKSISRFARNTVDTLDCVRQLRQQISPVGIYFLGNWKNHFSITYIETLSLLDQIHGIQIVAAPSWQPQILDWLTTADVCRKFKGFSPPGDNRQLSIYHGLEDIMAYGEETNQVLIHDAARPLLSQAMVIQCLEAMPGHDGVLPVLPMKDTVYSSVDGKTIASLLNRSEIFAGQAPELFRLGSYYEANKRLLPEKILNINGSTEPAVLAGLDVAMIPGDEGNFKITTLADLERFQNHMEEQKR